MDDTYDELFETPEVVDLSNLSAAAECCRSAAQPIVLLDQKLAGKRLAWKPGRRTDRIWGSTKVRHQLLQLLYILYHLM